MSEARKAIESYEKSIPRFDDWQERTCVGYYGYGSGRSLVAGRAIFEAGGPAEMACTVCPKNQVCWDELRNKAAGVFPGLVAEFDRLAEQHQGAELLKAWQRLTTGSDADGGRYLPDPYMALNLTNMQVGQKHEAEDGAD